MNINNPVRAREISEETRRKLSKALKGHIKSSEHRRHLSEALAGKERGPNLKRRRRITKKCLICGNAFEVPISMVNSYATCSRPCGLLYRSKRRRGKKTPWHHKITAKTKGQKRTWAQNHEYRKRMSEIGKKNKEKRHTWKGGITRENKIIRSGVEYKLWREGVFERDNYTCVLCGNHGCYLHADHIKPFALFPELRFELSNGRALCIPCHEKTPTYKGYSKKITSGQTERRYNDAVY